MGTEVGAIVALFATLIAAYLNFRKAPGERESINLDNLGKVADGYQKIASDLRVDLDRKDREVLELQRRLGEKDQEISGLRAQLQGLLERVARLEASSP